ncbi:MAG: DUF1456 family protein [Pseudobdellovibrio sp.]
MINNDVIRSVRYILNLNDKKIVEIIKLADFEVQLVDVQDFLLKEDEPNYLECPDIVMANFLDGLIYFKRGHDKDKPPVPFDLPISNNTILKKLRVAFELKEDDLHAIFDKAGFKIGKHELSAFLRKQGHSNYRNCGDQVLRYFLKGLTIKLRGSH